MCFFILISDPEKKERVLSRARQLMTEAGFKIGMSDGGRSLGREVSWELGPLVGSVGPLCGRFIRRYRYVHWSVGPIGGRSIGREVSWEEVLLGGRSLGRYRSLGRKVTWEEGLLGDMSLWRKLSWEISLLGDTVGLLRGMSFGR